MLEVHQVLHKSRYKKTKKVLLNTEDKKDDIVKELDQKSTMEDQSSIKYDQSVDVRASNKPQNTPTEEIKQQMEKETRGSENVDVIIAASNQQQKMMDPPEENKQQNEKDIRGSENEIKENLDGAHQTDDPNSIQSVLKVVEDTQNHNKGLDNQPLPFRKRKIKASNIMFKLGRSEIAKNPDKENAEKTNTDWEAVDTHRIVRMLNASFQLISRPIRRPIKTLS